MMTNGLFDRVLIANRGEIACRIARTCREMGLHSIAVYSDADADAPHVRAADEAVRIGEAAPSASYLNIEAVLDAARRTHAQAIHPGYGFLSENAAFARAATEAGLVFIGPRAETIEAMGSKTAARRLMQRAGVPIVPGFDGGLASDEAFAEAAVTIGFPVLIKASAGGGGKGMAIVRQPADLPAALAQARRLARAAFGDDALLLERYVEAPRHVEVQIFGDTHGQVVHLFERECSVQRRFQKVIEESPSPAAQLTPELRDALCQAGVRAAQAMAYVGAGTCEFLLDQDGSFYFLEVNTRLQVEHPVTECVTGLDLVRLQLLVAMGASIGDLVGVPSSRGSAIECRLYAEDPDLDFLPVTGEVVVFEVPVGPGLRVDAGIASGSVVGIDYDPLLAKIIAFADTRAEALLRMRGALRRLRIVGLKTNLDFLRAVVGTDAFAAGQTHTHFIAEHFPCSPRRLPRADADLADALTVAAVFAARLRRDINPHLPALRSGFRNSRFRPQRVVFTFEGALHQVDYVDEGQGLFEVRVDGAAASKVQVRDEGPELRCVIDRRSRAYSVHGSETEVTVFAPALSYVLGLVPDFPPPVDAEVPGACVAPMPGRVVLVHVTLGETVVTGTPLLTLEAMKMEHTLTASSAGVVTAVHVESGQRVDAGALLALVSAEVAW